MSRPDAARAPAVTSQALTLHHNEHHDSTLYRFEIGTRLVFRPGPSLYGRKVLLYTNYVIEDESGTAAPFARSQYHLLPWLQGGRGEAGQGEAGQGEAGQGETGHGEAGHGPLTGALHDGDVYAEVTLSRPGPYHYYFVYEQGGASCGSGWLQVAPRLAVPLGALCCQTALTKCLGALGSWRRVLLPAHHARYNLLHLSPVQALGGSGSSYSIQDQLRLDPRLGEGVTFDDLRELLQDLRDEWGMLSICDVVLNHTANETPWLTEHPEATYNCLHSPHLRPAALVDAAVARVSAQVSSGALECRGVPAALSCPQHVAALRELLQRELAALRLQQCAQCPEELLLRRFQQLCAARLPAPAGPAAPAAPTAAPDPGRRRLRAKVDLEAAVRQLYRPAAAAAPQDSDAALQQATSQFRAQLRALNEAADREMTEHLRAAVDNILAGVSYERLAADGPRLPLVTPEAPLAPRYFTFPLEVETCSPEELEEAVFGPAGALVQAHNGWLMNADPLQDFAGPDQEGRVYLRRELIAWGDSVKLRYGSRPEDCPFLWEHMRQYVQLTATLFDGLRLDNCHSTPLHVAEFLLDAARQVRPQLYVVAELFTNSDHVDNIYVNRLGITALIREALSAGDCREQGRLVHRFGGPPVGSLRVEGAVGAAGGGEVQEAVGRVAPALLLDLTHDNPSPLRTRTAWDLLASAAVCAMAGCAVGSTRGYDELLPDNVHVVTERRLYAEWSDAPPEGGPFTVGPRTGLMPARRLLNLLHQRLAGDGFTEIFVDQIDEDVVAITRQNPVTRESVVLVARSVFREERGGGERWCAVRLEGAGAVSGELSAELRGRALPAEGGGGRLAGLRGLSCEARGPGDLPAWAEHSGGELRLRLPPGAVLAVRVQPPPAAVAALRQLDEQLAAADPFQLQPLLRELSLAEFNTLLYCCSQEERAAGGGDVYSVPGLGPLLYAGLMGAQAVLERAAAGDDLGHPLCANLRAGDWLAEYSAARLGRGGPALRALGAALGAALAPLRALPRPLQPAYVWRVWRALSGGALRAALGRLEGGARAGGARRLLALCSVSLTAATPGAPLPLQAGAPSLSAGLPHFAAGHMRVWGRDTFISLRGLFLLTGRWADARAHILGFAACLRHGLIPNLLDGGHHARYNCRDAVWWWLYSIQQYCKEVPDGESILQEQVRRVFPTDDSPALESGPLQPLCDVMQEALQAHFEGRQFRERGAGRQLDAHMSEQGFLVQVGVQPDTGFVFGGSQHNAGTWMDKVGSSQRAGTRGRPATPRDGSAIEIVALCHTTLAWLAGLPAARYPHPGVARGPPPALWTWAAWAARVAAHFERHYWVPEQPSAQDARPDLVHRRAIYKDCCGADQPWADYQLRPNQAVAMCVAPQLFTPRHAWLALATVREQLATPLGLRTLDPADWNYRPDYRNSDDSADPAIAHGFNYHQGPAWLWPMPFYCRALLHFGAATGHRAEAAAEAWAVAGRLAAVVMSSPWRGLPELTDGGGAPCPDSCHNQAWSAAAALELLLELRPEAA